MKAGAKTYIIHKNSVQQPGQFTALDKLCKANSIDYSKVAHGNRVIIKGADVYRIYERTNF